MTDKAIWVLGDLLTKYTLELKRCPTPNEYRQFIKEFLRARGKGLLMVP